MSTKVVIFLSAVSALFLSCSKQDEEFSSVTKIHTVCCVVPADSLIHTC